jgi:ATP-binding cassette, subfamily B, bacterial PglK
MLEKIFSILGKKQSFKVKILFGLMLISMLLETVGIGLVLPFIDIVDKGPSSALMELGYLPNWIYDLSHKQLIYASLIFLVSFFIVKNTFLALMAWHRASFLNIIQNDISRRLFKGYLDMPYAFHLKKNSSHLIRAIRDEATHFIGGLDHFIEIFTQGFVLLGILTLLIWAEPVGGVIVFLILGVAGFLFHKITKNKVSEWGEENLYREGLRLQHLQQGLNGIKDVKIFRKEENFLHMFQVNNTSFLNTNKKHKFLSSLPKLWFEFLAIVGISILTSSILMQGKTIESLVSILALYAAAIFRIMPNINNILVGLQGIQFAKANINSVRVSLLEIEKNILDKNCQTLNFNKLIEFKDVSFSYENTPNRPILKKINLKIFKGEMLGIIGSSGAGKSTFVDIMIGLLSPTSGGIFADNVDISTNIQSWIGRVGYVPQDIYLTDDTLRNNIAFGVPEEEIDQNSVNEAIKLSDLKDFINNLSEGLNTKVGEHGSRLSGGQRQRIGIARALYHRPDLIILDEATSALDIETEKRIMESIKKISKTKTVVIITHRPSTLADCKKVYKIESGSLVDINKDIL